MVWVSIVAMVRVSNGVSFVGGDRVRGKDKGRIRVRGAVSAIKG